MNRFFKEYSKMKRINSSESKTCAAGGNVFSNNNNNNKNNDDDDRLSDIMSPPTNILQLLMEKKKERELNADERNFLLAAERGDLATVKMYLEQANLNTEKLNINCVDPLGRSALLIAIEYENLEMMELLLNHHVQVGEALLHAINEEFVEAVEILLAYQDQDAINSMEQQALLNKNRELDNPESSNIVNASNAKQSNANNETLVQNQSSKSFTPDITSIILAAHKDNYEIIKILLDRGERIPEPHDVRCNCNDCAKSRKEDSLRYSRSRINAFRALASPSLISLSSKDPILTAFELSWELRRLSRIENEFKDDYEKLSLSCQEYASALLGETRTSKELEIILNHDHENLPVVNSEKMTLSRLKLAIKYKQKKFVAHSHCQQLLVSLWYEGIPGFRRRNLFLKVLGIILISLFFPVFCVLYLFLPNHKFGRILKQPFIKFICHSASYVLFLFLLILASQRIKSVINDSDENDKVTKSKGEKRGPLPTSIEWIILLYVLGFIWAEIKQLYQEGVAEYLSNWWNLLDFITNALYVITITLRLTAYFMVKAERAQGLESADYSRESWDPWDPTLISEGLFAAANIFSSLKLVYIFTINPHLGPLQISLGRMIFDIMKFSVLILLVVFSFACGLNQLYWYYANMKENECMTQERENLEDCLLKFKYFSNLFETLQTLYWGTFGLVEKDRMEIHRQHKFTMFLGLLMFGVYCAIMIIILINMLIAMMSNSYQAIANQADEEWKFARSKLWLSYFEGGCTLPTPFSLIPSPKTIFYVLRWFFRRCSYCRKTKRKQQRWLSIRKIMKKISEREYKYQAVVKELVKRYIMKQQKRDRNAAVTEDDLNEIKQDISGLRFELLDIFKNNGYKVDSLKQNFANKIGRKRVKLNLEKAMTKNFFDTTSNLFEALITNEAATAHNHQHSKNVQFQQGNDHKRESTIKDIKETASSVQSPIKNEQLTPSFYKMANKFKKLKDTKSKKSSLTDSFESKTLVDAPTPSTATIIAAVSTITTAAIPIQQQQSEMTTTTRGEHKALLKQSKKPSVEETFTERITEV